MDLDTINKSKIDRLLEISMSAGFEAIDRVILPGKPASYESIPDALNPRIRNYLRRLYPDGLYSHQANAIEAALGDEDICLATPTASGKSLVFMTAALQMLSEDPSVTILAFYPAKALIQDQLNKWKSVLGEFGMEPGYIDGGVPMGLRPGIMQSHRVLLMTPDVAHAWLMSNLKLPEVSRFLDGLHLIILDEAHVYDGVFGTNMAYFLRRLLAVSSPHRIISSTATIGDPAGFLKSLSGRQSRVFDADTDGSAMPPKTAILLHPSGNNRFECVVRLLAALPQAGCGRFLAFADSRKMVEQLVAATHRGKNALSAGWKDNEDDFLESESDTRLIPSPASLTAILPYRAGYEVEDRQLIQKALEQGNLAGVVSTSALELGLDIGDIDLVLLLGTPPSVKAFRQRMGRCGRRSPGICLLIDDRGSICSVPGKLTAFLEKPSEKGWLYLDNRFIQYSHALCAAAESAEVGESSFSPKPFESVPPSFLRFLENELNPTESISDDLYPLKQRAQSGPHLEFPLRSGIEKNFQVRSTRGSGDHRLGSLTFSQALREAYPGAIYYYMARPYRVFQFKYQTGEIIVKPEKRWTTKPMLQNMVFPKFRGGLLGLLCGADSFVAEAELQVSERVLGLIEKRGSSSTSLEYGTGSPYSQRPLQRFFETTGICIYFADPKCHSEAAASALLEAFCLTCGVEARDLGIGTFHSKRSPLGTEPCQGICIYDATHGSLRLSQRLLEKFPEVTSLAVTLAAAREMKDSLLESALLHICDLVRGLRKAKIPRSKPEPILESEWTHIIAPCEKAVYIGAGAPQEAIVLGYRYTPYGLMYELKPDDISLNHWMVRAGAIMPINGVTKMQEVNLTTGETRS